MPGDPVEDDRNDFLRELIFNDRLYGTALEITKRVIEWGENALPEKERYVFQRNVIEVFVTDECSRWGCRIPWSEMYQNLSVTRFAKFKEIIITRHLNW